MTTEPASTKTDQSSNGRNQSTMTPQDVRDRIAEIGREARDPERAHLLEDGLYRDVLAAIANWKPEQGTLEYRALCQEALKSQDVDISRWTA